MKFGRKRLIGFLLVLTIGSIITLVVMLRHEPAFYRRSVVTPGPDRYDLSNEFFLKEFVPFIGNFTGGKGGWSLSFTQDHINSFFEEDFIRFGDADHFRKLGITNPRLEFNDNQIRLGFRYGTGEWSSVLSYDLKLWLARNEINVLAVEIQRRRAGALPMPSQHIFQELAEMGRKHNIEISWYRHQGNPVAIVRFQCDRPRPSAQLRHLEVANGRFTLQGMSFDPVENPFEEPLKKSPVQVSQVP